MRLVQFARSSSRGALFGFLRRALFTLETGSAAHADGAEHLSGALSATGMALLPKCIEKHIPDGCMCSQQQHSARRFCIDKECKIVEWTPKMEMLACICQLCHGCSTAAQSSQRNQSPIESLAPERLSLDNANCTDWYLNVSAVRPCT